MARAEVAGLKEDTSERSRARLRQAADKGWFSLTTAADAYIKKTEGKSEGAKNTKQAAEVYSKLGVAQRHKFDQLRAHLHIACGYGDDMVTCRIPSVKSSLKEAGQLIYAVDKLLKK